MLIGMGILLGAGLAAVFWNSTGDSPHKLVASAAQTPDAVTPPPMPSASTDAVRAGQWDGPVLYRSQGSPPLHLILVEKTRQTLRLFRFDGGYSLVKTYPCATGENEGKKRKENDERTPEGIYFNTKTYRDRKVTVFGDRAFELNYPNPYDNMEGNGGRGIYIHGSNRPVTPFSTNGCVAMDNAHLADLDSRVDMKKTPIIIGEKLPYRFNAPGADMAPLLPVIRQAMRPKELDRQKASIEGLTVLAYGDDRLAVGTVRGEAPTAARGESRLYMSRLAPEMTVLIKGNGCREHRRLADRSPPRPLPAPRPQLRQSRIPWRHGVVPGRPKPSTRISTIITGAFPAKGKTAASGKPTKPG
jgi:lipoprotein-anchoring transpeptidase ErfK/SrfK